VENVLLKKVRTFKKVPIGRFSEFDAVSKFFEIEMK